MNQLQNQAPVSGSENPLGIYGNTPSKFPKKSSRSYHYKNLVKDNRKGRKFADRIRSRIQSEKIHPLKSRVGSCGSPRNKVLPVNKSDSNSSVKISGVETCKSVWNCPVCRGNISVKRGNQQREINEGWTGDRKEFMDNIIENGFGFGGKEIDEMDIPGGKIYHLTLTAPHKMGDDLDKLIGFSRKREVNGVELRDQGMIGAVSRFKSGSWFKKKKVEIGYFADVRAFDITYGRNGWHPHFHILLYTKKEIDVQEMKKTFFNRWKQCCVAAGLDEPKLDRFGRGAVDLREAVGRDDYIIKWDSAAEIASTGKKGRHGSLSIPEMELLLIDSEETEKLKSEKEIAEKISGHKVRNLLRMFYNTMKGRKMLTWGGNHKQLKGSYLEEYQESDEETAKMDEKDNRIVGGVTSALYMELRKTGNYSTFCSLWEKYGFEVVRNFITECMGPQWAMQVTVDPEVIKQLAIQEEIKDLQREKVKDCVTLPKQKYRYAG